MKKAFTLIELMIVVTIIGVIAAMVIPAVEHFRKPVKPRQEQFSRSNENYSATQPSVSKEIVINGRLYRLVEN